MGKSKGKGGSFQPSLPKGLPQRKNSKPTKAQPYKNQNNPFERRIKKYNSKLPNVENKVNTFKDKRIKTNELDVVRRLAKERVQSSKKTRFNLQEEELLHRGKKLTDLSPSELKPDSDDEEEYKLQTELHFGGDKKLNRKELLEERILKAKKAKDEKKQLNEKQINTFESMDEGFSDLAALLNFRKDSKDSTSNLAQVEDDDWDKQQKGFQVSSAENKKVKATDRTKTPDEIAKEEKEKLEELELKRLKRMNGEFDDDSLSDVSSIEDEEVELQVGSTVLVKYHAKEQELFPQEEQWHPATILKTNNQYYDVKYSDGEVEEKVHVKHIKISQKPKVKQQKAISNARKSIPYTFSSNQIPTTIEMLHEDLIAEYASSPSDVTTILKRIYTSTNTKLHPENKEKYHNFYDVLLRRFILVGNAIEEEDEERWDQLDYLVELLYDISQDCPHNAMSVWSRRLKIFSNAFTKKCEDLGLTTSSSPSAWPSYGTILLLRSLIHIFPSTDFRHVVTTPAMLLLNQYIAHAPIRSLHDLVTSLYVCGLIMQYNKETKRIVPEVYAYLSSVLWLYYHQHYQQKTISFVPIPNVKASVSYLTLSTDLNQTMEKLSLRHESPKAILTSTLLLIQSCVHTQKHASHQSNHELFADLYKSLVLLSNTSSAKQEDDTIHSLVLETIVIVSEARTTKRYPLQRSISKTKTLKELTPRLESVTQFNELQQLKREYKQNQKSTIKQIRKDAQAMELQRRSMLQSTNDVLKHRRAKNYSMLEEDQASMNQQVRMNGVGKGGGMGGVKDLMKRDGIRKRKQR